MNTNETKLTMNDHDLLVVLHTKLERVLVDLKEVKDNTVGRISVLEATKLDKTEAESMTKKAIAAADEIHEDHETRIRSLEKSQSGLSEQLSVLSTRIATYGSAALIILGIIQFLASKFL